VKALDELLHRVVVQALVGDVELLLLLISVQSTLTLEAICSLPHTCSSASSSF